jgi:hypothetical protein
MFKELEKVMNYAIEDGNYLESLGANVINKKTSSGIEKTTGYLKRLYSFDPNNNSFKAFKYFWLNADEKDKPILSLLFAITNDYLLSESIDVVLKTNIGEKASIENFEKNIELHHPNKYTQNTRKSIAQNIASSWKQAGFISGKVKNIRSLPDISYNTLAFAFYLAFLNGLRGDFILTSKWVKALSLNEAQIRELAIEANKRDLLHYQFGGSVTTISFTNLQKELEIDVV